MACTIAYSEVMICIAFVCSSVHGFQPTDLLIEEGDTQETIQITLDIKGDTLAEPADTRITSFEFQITCLGSSSSDGPPASG